MFLNLGEVTAIDLSFGDAHVVQLAFDSHRIHAVWDIQQGFGLRAARQGDKSILIS